MDMGEEGERGDKKDGRGRKWTGGYMYAAERGAIIRTGVQGPR
jgi:hypothetical protein